MSDYNEELSELHQLVVQEELGLPATIDDESGWVQFTHPDLGEVAIVLREYNPEYMVISCTFFQDKTRKREDLMRVCNQVNGEEFAKLSVSDAGFVRAEVGLFVAAPRNKMTIKGKLFPDEEFLRAVYRLAISSLNSAVESFTTELEKLG